MSEDLAAAVSRVIDWPAASITQGELLGSFVAHCAGDLDDVEVVSHEDAVLVARWRSETSRIELRSSLTGLAGLAGGPPTMVVGDLEPELGTIVEAFLADAKLRESVVVFDPVRLEKVGAVRSSVFVYLEWFLRDAYGVKVLPAGAFTRGLIERGVISLGMG